MSDTPHIASCIPQVPGTRFLKVREDLVETLGDHCLAGLVQVCIGWYDYHSASPERVLRVTAALSAKYGTVPVDVTRAFYMSVNQAENAMFGLYKKDKIIESLKKLESIGLLERVENPFPDETTNGVNWYAFHPAILARMIHEKYGVRFIRTDDGCLKTDTPPIGKPTGGIGKPTGACRKTDNILDSSLDNTKTTNTIKANDILSESFTPPTDEAVEKYRVQCNERGAKYTPAEWRMAVLGLRERGWRQWGSDKIIGDWRAAIERQIGWDRGHRIGQAEPDEATPEDNLQDSASRPRPMRKYQELNPHHVSDAELATWRPEEIADVEKFIKGWETGLSKHEVNPEHVEYGKTATAEARAFLERIRKAKAARMVKIPNEKVERPCE